MGQFTLGGRVIKAVVFDMDGTAIDCEPHNRAAVQNAAGEQHQIDWAECAGRPESVIHEWLSSKYTTYNGLSDNFVAACKQGYVDSLPSLRPRAGMIDLMNTFKELGIPMAVVTNTDKAMAIKKLTHCGLIDYLGDVIGKDTVIEAGLRPKPSGDGYKMAAKAFGIAEEEVMGFEDSHVGMEALAETDMFSIHIHDNGTDPHDAAGIHIDGSCSNDLLVLNSIIRSENANQLILPQPSRAAHPG